MFGTSIDGREVLLLGRYHSRRAWISSLRWSGKGRIASTHHQKNIQNSLLLGTSRCTRTSIVFVLHLQDRGRGIHRLHGYIRHNIHCDFQNEEANNGKSCLEISGNASPPNYKLCKSLDRLHVPHDSFSGRGMDNKHGW